MSTPSAAPDAAEPGATLLFVDDEPNILSSLQRLFRPLGYRIFTAGGGAEGLEVLAREPIDLVVSDMRMPQMDGAAFLAQVAERWPDTVRILLTGYADLSSAVAAINQGGIYRYLSKPWEDNDIKLTVHHALEKMRLRALVERQNAELKELNSSLEARVRARTEEVRQVLSQLELSYEELRKGYATSVKVFANLIEMRQPRMAGSARGIAELARHLAVKLGLGDAQTQQLEFAALLHDIGKIGFPDRLLTTPYDKLAPADRTLFETHPVVGQTTLMPLENLQDAALIIRQHRERFDGRGYPDRRKGEEIPLAARILSVVVDHEFQLRGLLNGRSLTAEQARDWLVAEKGGRHDPSVVDAFVIALGQPRPVAERQVSANQLQPGMVLSRDLQNTRGLLLVGSGRLLGQSVIERIQALERQEGGNYVIHVLNN